MKSVKTKTEPRLRLRRDWRGWRKIWRKFFMAKLGLKPENSAAGRNGEVIRVRGADIVISMHDLAVNHDAFAVKIVEQQPVVEALGQLHDDFVAIDRGP